VSVTHAIMVTDVNWNVQTMVNVTTELVTATDSPVSMRQHLEIETVKSYSNYCTMSYHCIAQGYCH